MQVQVDLICKNCGEFMKGEYIGRLEYEITPCDCLVNEAVQNAIEANEDKAKKEREK